MYHYTLTLVTVNLYPARCAGNVIKQNNNDIPNTNLTTIKRTSNIVTAVTSFLNAGRKPPSKLKKTQQLPLSLQLTTNTRLYLWLVLFIDRLFYGETVSNQNFVVPS